MTETIGDMESPETITNSERHVVSRITVEPETLAEVMSAGIMPSTLDREVIKDPESRYILKTIFELAEEGYFSSHNVVREELKEKGVLEELGGHEWWSDWVGMGMAEMDFDYHLTRVLDAGEVRNSRDVLETAAETAGDETLTVRQRREEIRRLTGDLIETQMQRIESLVRTQKMWETVEISLDSRNTDLYLRTGLWGIDDRFGGIPFGRLSIGAARPGHGKTLMAETISFNCARRWQQREAEKQVLYFDLENNTIEKSIRLLTLAANQEIQHPDNGIGARVVEQVMQGDAELTDVYASQLEEGGRLLRAVSDHLVVDRTTSPTGNYVRARVESEARRREVGLVVLDYMELMGVPGGGRIDRNERVTLGAESLHAMARELEIPVLGISQLSRSADHREEPVLSDLSWSDALGKLARQVWLLVHPYTKEVTTSGEVPEDVSRAILNVFFRKNKGGIGEIDLRMLPSCLRIYDHRDPELEMTADDEMPF